MTEDWAADVRRYAPDADDAVIAGIVRHCGIALRTRDASLVAFGDKAETDLVRESFLRKKLGLAESDEVLDAAIAAVGERMKGDPTKNRVTVYYLLAEHFGKLGLFAAGATAAAAEAAKPAPDPLPLMAAAPPPPPRPAAPIAPAAAAGAAAVAAMPLAGAHAHGVLRRREQRDDGGIVGVGLGALGVMGAAIVFAGTAGSLIGNPPTNTVAPVSPPQFASAPAVPEGAGVVATVVAGQPMVSVYFDTASAEVTPEFAAEAAPVKAWIDANPGDRLAVSGYNDPRGDRAFNEELSKNRAQNVAAALVAIGVPQGAIDLVKPEETTDATTTLENARRVDIVVRGAG
jgi:outer membrane protein OmpA-like peptidoglycan-associated protein